MASLFGHTGVEEPPFKVVTKTDVYEVREYGPQVRAEVHLPGGIGANNGRGFRAIAGYIFGGNTSRHQPEQNEKVAMTAPVTMKVAPASSERVAMTAPVTMSASDTDSGKGMVMSFIMPSKYKSVEDLPVPKNAEVKLTPVPAKTYAVIRFSWNFNEPRMRLHEERLREAAAKDGLKLVQDPAAVELWAFNPPWTLPWCKRNEVAIPVAAS